MLTVENLTKFGANTTEALQRCMGNEMLYLKLVNRFLEDNSFTKLKEALANDDLETAFQCAHALKGVLANLSLTPLLNVIFEMTELLRNRQIIDYSNYLERYEKAYSELVSLR